MYLGWYDPDKKKPAERKLRDAIDRFDRKWGRLPTVALVSAADAGQIGDFAGVDVRSALHVAPNTFFVGDDEPSELDADAA